MARLRPALYSAGVPLSWLVQKRLVDLLDVDPAVLYRLERFGELDQLACGDLGIGEGAWRDEFHSNSGLSESADADQALPWSANPAAAICRHSGPNVSEHCPARRQR